MLVGAFPNSGTGSLNLYEIYGNFFFHNPREALFQGSGRVSLHDNIFVDGPHYYPAVVLRRHNFPLKLAYVYNNTVYTTERGIYFGTRAELGRCGGRQSGFRIGSDHRSDCAVIRQSRPLAGERKGLRKFAVFRPRQHGLLPSSWQVPRRSH